MSAIGLRLKEIRNKLRLSQEAFGKKTGLLRAVLQLLEQTAEHVLKFSTTGHKAGVDTGISAICPYAREALSALRAIHKNLLHFVGCHFAPPISQMAAIDSYVMAM